MKLFQTLDNKKECVGIYTEDELIFDREKFPSDLTATWAPTAFLKGMEVEFASLYLEGKKVRECLPEYLQDEWDDAMSQLKAFQRSLDISKVNQDDNCFYDLVPDRFLIDYCETKNKITAHVLKTIPRPRRYEFYQRVEHMLNDIASRPVSLDRRKLSSYLSSPTLGRTASTMLDAHPTVRYKQFGTKTGRLTNLSSGIPLLTLSKDLRSTILPTNDYFLELDFNGAEVRVMTALMGFQQPSGDIHQHHLENVFTKLKSRSEAKTAFFAWLYGSSALSGSEEEVNLLQFYDRERILSRFWDGDTLTTPYGKVINGVGAHHALNYLVQSTTAELALKQFLKIDHFLQQQTSGSHVAFLIHDAVVIDMKKADEKYISDLIYLMGSTNFGTFMVNQKRGLDLSMTDESLP